jgi:hypothetical protein
MNDAEEKLRDKEIELLLKTKDFLNNFERDAIERWIRVALSLATVNGAGLAATILAIKDFKDVIGLANIVVVATIFSSGLMLGGASYIMACFGMGADPIIAAPYLSPEQRAKYESPIWISAILRVIFLLMFFASAGAFVIANLAIIRFLNAARP